MQQQKLCLKWNNHTLNLLSVLETFQQKDILVDVTLSCEGHNIKAHKMVLSACSPYFQNIFLENPCQHPIVIINGMKYEDITAILNFMYKGEVNVSHDSLSSFLQAAEALKVKGLAEVCGEKKSPGSGIQEPEQNEQTRPQRTETPTTKRRQRNRKRSLSDSNRSDDEAAPRKHKGLNSPEVHELSGDESYTGDMSSNGQNSRVPQNVYSRSHQSSSNITADEMDDEYEVEPSKMLEQTLTTDNANSASSDNSLRIERIMGNATEMESSSLHEPESPPDIKPIIEYGESSAGPSEGSMMVYNEQSQPGPSSMQDGSLLHDNSHTQGFRMDIMKSLENFQKESLRQLNEILSRVNVIEKRIDDTGQEEEDPAATELEHVLPMKNIDQLRGLETKLKDKTYFIQVVNILKRIGGSDVYSVVVGILKRLLTNELAEQYSWAGAKKKLPFKDLTLFKLILETVRTHYPSTETEVGQLVAKWLVQARLRRERAEQGKFPYCIVEFTEGKNHVEVVPSSWIELSEGDEGETACWWPDDNCSKHVLRKTSPDSSWNLVKVKIVHFSRSHNNAMNSCKTSEIFTDIDMYSEEDMESSKEKCKEPKSRLRSRASLPSTSNNVQSSALLPAISPSSSYHLPTLSSCKNYNGDDDRLTKVLEYTTTLTHDVSQIRIDVSKICNHLNLNSLNIDLQDLPAKTGAELHELEKRLYHSEEFEKLVCFLGRHGGRDISDCTRRILSALMTNETSLTFNWVGGFGKKPFRNFKKIVQMITVSVRQNPNMKHAKMSDVENIIKKWLRYAGDRDGGRSKRKAKKVSNQEQ